MINNVGLHRLIDPEATIFTFEKIQFTSPENTIYFTRLHACQTFQTLHEVLGKAVFTHDMLYFG